MTTFIEALPETKSSKHSGIRWTPSATTAGAGLITIYTDRSRTEYALVEFQADGGRGFHLAKRTEGTDRDAEAYSLFIPTCGDSHPVCECRGFYFAGHCKHLDSVQALIDNRWI